MSKAITNLKILIDALDKIGRSEEPKERWWAHDAIDEIKSLQAQCDVYKEALNKIVSRTEDKKSPYRAIGADQMQRIANVALSGGENE